MRLSIDLTDRKLLYYDKKQGSSAAYLVKLLVKIARTRPFDSKQWLFVRRELARTVEYKEFRRRVIKRANGLCENCGEPGNHVHHILWMKDYPKLALDVSNGAYLCKACHKNEHS